MIRIALDLAGTLYTDGMAGLLEGGGKFRTETLLPGGTTAGKADSCARFGADIALLGVSPVLGYTVDERRELFGLLRERIPKCKLVVLLDEKLSPPFTDRVKDLKRTGDIDGFLYTSVSLDYMADMLETIVDPLDFIHEDKGGYV